MLDRPPCPRDLAVRAGGLAAAPPVSFEDRIYDEDGTGLLALIREVPPATGTLLLIGHNPAIEDLALMLAAPAGPPGAVPRPGTWNGCGRSFQPLRSRC